MSNEEIVRRCQNCGGLREEHKRGGNPPKPMKVYVITSGHERHINGVALTEAGRDQLLQTIRLARPRTRVEYETMTPVETPICRCETDTLDAGRDE